MSGQHTDNTRIVQKVSSGNAPLAINGRIFEPARKAIITVGNQPKNDRALTGDRKKLGGSPNLLKCYKKILR